MAKEIEDKVIKMMQDDVDRLAQQSEVKASLIENEIKIIYRESIG
jgi:hypothetical protein